jgi:hypothetical protein
MRALRTAVGVVLLLAGVPTVLLAAVGWSVLRAGPEAEGFAPTRAYIRTDGWAVLVADAAGLADRSRVTVLPGSDRVRITVHSGSALFVGLAPSGEARRYLDGVARTELTARGSVDVDGRAEPASPALQSFWSATGGTTLEWAPRPGTSLVIMRLDGSPGVEATVGLGWYPGWVGAGTWWLLVGGLAAVMAGVGLLAWPPRRREVVLVVEAHRMVDFADQLHSGRRQDVTGELVRLDRVGSPAPRSRERFLNDTARVTALQPNSDPAGLREETGESPYVSTAT